MSKKNLPNYEPLDDQLRMLKGDVSTPELLKTAVVSGTANGSQIPARVHVRQTAKAILLYAVCIALFLGAIMVLPNLFNSQPPVVTQPPTTTTPPPVTDRDTIQNPENYTEQELKALQAAWAVIKPHCGDKATINDYRIWNIFQLRDMIICQYKPKLMAPVSTYTQQTIAGYTFVYDMNSELYVFANQTKYILEDAYDAGVLSKEDVLSFLEYHKKENPQYYRNVHPDPDYPYVYDSLDPTLDLGKLLDGKTCVNDLIDQSSLHTNDRFKPWYPAKTDVDKLFDSIKTEADYAAAGAGVMGGGTNEFSCYFFDMKEKVKIAAYVITSGSENSIYTDRNVASWHLYATNDAEAAAKMREEGATYEEMIMGNEKWVDLDYVWDGGMHAVNFGEHGYVIDEAKQGEYRYYCWCVEYTGGGNIEVAELELYTD